MSFSPHDPGEVRLRAYRSGDALPMFTLDRACFEQRFRFSLHAMRDFAEAAGSIAVVAEVEAKMVGFAIAEVEEEVAYLVTIDVDPGWRRGGMAQAMVGWIGTRAWDRGARRLDLHVFVENEAAIRFYERLGFVLVGTMPGFYGSGADALYYSRRLDVGGVVRPV